MEYSRHKVSKIFGISLETLRHYENIGLIAVDANEENNFKMYHEEDIVTILIVVKLRKLGMSLGEIEEIIKHKKNTNHLYLLKELENEYNEKIAEYSNLKRYVNRIYGYHLNGLTNLNTTRLGEIHPHYYVYFEDCSDEELSETIAQMPRTNYIVELQNDAILLCNEFPLDYEYHDGLQEFKGGICVVHTIFTENVFNVPKEDVESVIRYGREHNLQLDDKIFGSIMGPETIEGKLGYLMDIYCRVIQ